MTRQPRKPRQPRNQGPFQDCFVVSRSTVPFAADLTPTGGKQIVWAQLRDRIVSTLERFPEARDALVEKLAEDLGLTLETRIQP